MKTITKFNPIVVQIYGSDITIIGGHEGFVRRLSTYLARMGYRVIIVHRSKDFRVDGAIAVGVRSLCLSPRICIALNLKKMVMVIRSADIVHVHSPSNPFAFLALVIAIALRKPVVSTILSYLADTTHHRLAMRLVSPLIALFETLAVLLSNAIHVENLRDYAMLRWSKKLGKILVFAEPIIKIQPAKHKFSKSSHKFRTILYIGRIDYAKGIHLLIKAAKYLPKNVRIVIAGVIQNYEYLTRLFDLKKKLGLEDRVFIIGPVSENVKHNLLEMCNVVVIPSLSDIVEAYSIVTTEAWIHGKPVVAYPVGALKYRVMNGVNGYLAKRARNPKALADAIIKALNLERVSIYVPRISAIRALDTVYKFLMGRLRK